MSFLFGRKEKSATEVLRENQRFLNRSIREIDKERVVLENQDKQSVASIKKLAKAGQMDSVKTMAKSVVQTRKSINKLYQMRTHLQAVSMQLQTLKTTQAMTQAMTGVSKALGVINRGLNVEKLSGILNDLEEKTNTFKIKEEMMSDSMASAFEEDDEEEEADQLMNKVLDEIGISVTDTLDQSVPPSSSLHLSQKVEQENADLEARLQNLRRAG